jgi:hypothetical protein
MSNAGRTRKKKEEIKKEKKDKRLDMKGRDRRRARGKENGLKK